MFRAFDCRVAIVVTQIPGLVAADDDPTSRAEDLLATLDAASEFTPAPEMLGAVQLTLALVPLVQLPAMSSFCLDRARIGGSSGISIHHDASPKIGGEARGCGWIA